MICSGLISRLISRSMGWQVVRCRVGRVRVQWRGVRVRVRAVWWCGGVAVGYGYNVRIYESPRTHQGPEGNAEFADIGKKSKNLAKAESFAGVAEEADQSRHGLLPIEARARREGG